MAVKHIQCCPCHAHVLYLLTQMIASHPHSAHVLVFNHVVNTAAAAAAAALCTPRPATPHQQTSSAAWVQSSRGTRPPGQLSCAQ
jgi:hypothetical protein